MRLHLAVIGVVVSLAASVSSWAQQQLSEHDIFAAYCVDSFAERVDAFRRTISTECSEGPVSCHLAKERLADMEKKTRRLLEYLSASGLLDGSEATETATQVKNVGKAEAAACGVWWQTKPYPLDAPYPSFCEKRDRCDDLSRFPM